MQNDIFIYGGAVALIALIASSWQQVKNISLQVISRVIVSCTIYDCASNAVMAYLQNNLKRSRYGPRSYTGWRLFVRPQKKVLSVGLESVGSGFRIFWKGWSPIWVSRTSSTGSDSDNTNIIFRPIKITFFRGTFNADQLIIDSLDFYNSREKNLEIYGGRYRIHRITGTDGKPMQIGTGSDTVAPSDESAVDRELFSYRVLKWDIKDFGPERVKIGSAIDQLALPADALTMIDEIDKWCNSRDWYFERGVPWKRGYALFGVPGTGKTALVRAIAEDFDLPVYVFNLTTLYIDELLSEWSRMLSDTPCIALIEDIDSVFDGRKNEKGHLTFDCLLNCIDGVEKSNGLLTFITTNNPEKVDSALGGCESKQEMSPRPGRIDRVVEMGILDKDGRLKLATRILLDWPDRWSEVVIEGKGDTGAQFQERCSRLALELYWADQHLSRKMSDDDQENDSPTKTGSSSIPQSEPAEAETCFASAIG